MPNDFFRRLENIRFIRQTMGEYHASHAEVHGYAYGIFWLPGGGYMLRCVCLHCDRIWEQRWINDIPLPDATLRRNLRSRREIAFFQEVNRECEIPARPAHLTEFAT